MFEVVQSACIVYPLMAHDFTIHKQTVQTNKFVTLKETNFTNNLVHYFIVITDKNKVITQHITVIRILVDDRGKYY